MRTKPCGDLAVGDLTVELGLTILTINLVAAYPVAYATEWCGGSLDC